jgi:hypothetical protein
MPKNNLQRPGPKERVCYNCKHMIWLVGVGQGVRCGFNSSPNKMPPIIPSLRHTCNKFKFNNEQPESEGVTDPA